MSAPDGEHTRTVRTDYLARVEGEGSLHVKVRAGEVIEARLEIFEPPRFFEAFLRGRGYEEPPDITSRICGICPIAYQMSASRAIEDALGVEVDGPLRDLRRLIYCGEWVESPKYAKSLEKENTILNSPTLKKPKSIVFGSPTKDKKSELSAKDKLDCIGMNILWNL
jgi:coenzyme F420-reducing hydrogenase alpha subunit